MKRLLGLLALTLLATLVVATPADAQNLVRPCQFYTSPPTATIEGAWLSQLCDANGRQVVTSPTGATASQVQGTIASGATDSTNPVKVGGVYNSTLPTFTNGQRGDVQIGTRGSAHVEIYGPDSTSTPVSVTALADAGSSPPANMRSTAYGYQYNGATWDRQFTCPNSVAVSVAPGTTQLVALQSSQIVRVCSFMLSESLAGTAKFVYGTGASCGTGTTDITAAMVMATNGSLQLSAGSGSLFRTIASNALCLTSVTGTVTGFITYAQY